MALLVANGCSERFSATATAPVEANSKAPPPKKKWIQAYLEMSTDSSTPAASFCRSAAAAAAVNDDDDMIMSSPDGQLASEVIGDVVQDVIDQFQDYIDVTRQRTHKNNSRLVYARARRAAEAEQMARLLYTSHNSRKFTEGLERLSSWDASASLSAYSTAAPLSMAADYRGAVSTLSRQETLSANTTTPPPPVEEFSKEDIGGVVQDVISQFLNGDTSSLFRRSRRHKRRRHRSDKLSLESSAGEEGVSAEGRVGEQGNAAKVARLEVVDADENGVLNLSLPKQPDRAVATAAVSPSVANCGPRVTFALEDKCYAEDGTAQLFLSASGDGRRLPGPPMAAGSDGRKHLTTAVVRPGVIAAPPALHRLQQHKGLVSSPVSACVHFDGVVSSQAAASFLNGTPTVQSYLNTSKSFSFSSVIRPLPATAAPMASTALTADISQPPPLVPVEVKPKVSAAAASMIKIAGSKTPSTPRRQVIVKSFAAVSVREKSPTAVSTATSSLAAVTAADLVVAENNGNIAAAGSSSGGTNREVHNRLEKNRRAHLKSCFDELASECELDARKASNLTVIKTALKTIMVLRRKEREHEKELADLVQEKIRRQQLLAQLQEQLPPATVTDAGSAAVDEDEED